MAESPARYCSNCGNELNLNDRFCQNCGTPVQQAATVPTPEADVPVPPPPQVGATAPPPPQARGTQQSWPRRHPLLTGCLGIVGVFTLLIIALVAAVANSGGGGNGGGNVAEKPKQDHKAAQPAQPEKKEQPEEEEQKQSQQQPQQEDKASKPAPQPQYASVGQKATVDDEAYQVNKAWKQNGIHSALENLEGTFVVVDFTFYNAGSETRGCYELVRRMPAACWRKRQANATK